jgi:hypothetical protein
MEKQSAVPWLIVAGICVLALAYWYTKKRAQNVAMANSQVSNPVARGVNTATNVSSSVLHGIPVAGGALDTMLNRPAQNVLSGDVHATAGSILTGGASDFWSGANPLNWF